MGPNKCSCYYSDWIEGLPVQASPEALHCGPLARHFILCLVLVQPSKTHPDMTENLLTGWRCTTLLKNNGKLNILNDCFL